MSNGTESPPAYAPASWLLEHVCPPYAEQLCPPSPPPLPLGCIDQDELAPGLPPLLLPLPAETWPAITTAPPPPQPTALLPLLSKPKRAAYPLGEAGRTVFRQERNQWYAMLTGTALEGSAEEQWRKAGDASRGERRRCGRPTPTSPSLAASAPLPPHPHNSDAYFAYYSSRVCALDPGVMLTFDGAISADDLRANFLYCEECET
jgi:hypothetical protein